MSETDVDAGYDRPCRRLALAFFLNKMWNRGKAKTQSIALNEMVNNSGNQNSQNTANGNFNMESKCQY